MFSNTGKARERIDSSTFDRLRTGYVIALGAIALVVISGQLLIQNFLKKQVNDSRVINVAGRQRMLSQRITKQTLLLSRGGAEDSLKIVRQALRRDLHSWRQAHQALQQGAPNLGLPNENSPKIDSMFQRVNPIFETLYLAVKQAADASAAKQDLPIGVLQEVLDNERQFLSEMDQIVFQYDAEAQAKVQQIQRIEWWLLAISLGILLLEFLLIFRPAALHVRGVLQKLLQSEQEARGMAAEMNDLYQAKEKSLQELRALNYAVDQAALFANCSADGQVRHLSEKLRQLLGYKNQVLHGQLSEIMCADAAGQKNIEQSIQKARNRIWTGEILISTHDQRRLWLEMAVIPVSPQGLNRDLLILCSDITFRKDAQAEIERLNQERFEEQLKQQILRSVQVLDAQEEERKRIARDMHDGIGQMLSALKLNLDAINLDQPEKAKPKLEKLQNLATQVIQEVRIVTFNLTPPELSDYGISTGLARLASELGRLTGNNILFENQNQFNERLDAVVETNLYRITQEAVNNAVKYAKANYILIKLSHSENMLSIVIDDDGLGFDPDEVELRSDGSGRGLAFMQERMQFIQGRMFLRSEPGEGTRITLNVPLGDN
jgi:two-component system, NarL family, sensor histidine kinase DegS